MILTAQMIGNNGTHLTGIMCQNYSHSSFLNEFGLTIVILNEFG